MSIVLEIAAILVAALLGLLWLRRVRRPSSTPPGGDWVDTAADVATRRKLRRRRRRP